MAQPSPDQQIRTAALESIAKIFDPLIGIMIDTGITVQEASQLMRVLAVRKAAKRVRNESGRNNNSRVAIITGLPRSEVARLHAVKPVSRKKASQAQHPAQRVLSAWHESPPYLMRTGEPAILPIFGPRPSFEKLVHANVSAIPVRAMLDELLRIDAIEQLPDQRLRVKSRTPILQGINLQSIRALGDRASDLLGTLTRNLLEAKPLFEATAFIADAQAGSLGLVKREVANQGTSFMGSIDELLKKASDRAGSASSTDAGSRAGVSVYYFENETPGEAELSRQPRRKNLRRTITRKPSRRTG